MQISAGMLLLGGVILCFASTGQDDPRFRAYLTFWGLLIYSAGYGVLWVDHLIREYGLHNNEEEEEEESSANTP